MSDIIGAGIDALEKLVSVAEETRRRAQEKPFRAWSDVGFQRFREWDAAICRACDEAGILQPNVAASDQYAQLLGFVRLPFLKGRIPWPTVAWYEAMRTLKVRLQAKLSTLEAPAVPQFDAILLELSKAQQLLFRELWDKGAATYERLRKLRGDRAVTPDAERQAINRLADKVIAITTGKVRIEKTAGGVRLVK